MSAVGVFTTNSYGTIGQVYSELTYISTSPAIPAYLNRPTVVSLWSRSSGLPPYQPQPSVLIHRRPALLLLLLLAGDVEHNPGPPRTTATPTADQLIECINIGVVNCRSAVHKATLMHDQRPDLQNILRQSDDHLTIMPTLQSTYDGRIIYQTSYEERRANSYVRFTCKIVS